jgi:hypothetical protein
VVESSDPSLRGAALQFARTWFVEAKWNNSYNISIANQETPLVDRDGTCLVWVYCYDASQSCLNEELARAGLVEIDQSFDKDFTFSAGKHPKRHEDIVVPARRRLEKAKESGKRGEAPHVRFPWPP